MAEHTSARYYVTMGYLTPIFTYLRNQGCDQAPYLQLLGVQEADLRNSDLRVPDAACAEIFALAAQELQDANVGLHMGRTMRLQHVGIIGFLILNCERVRDVFDLHSRYQMLVGNGLRTTYLNAGPEYCMQIEPQNAAQSRHNLEYSIGAWSNFQDQLVAEPLFPSRVELPYTRPTDTAELEEVFHAPISFGTKNLRVYFPADHADLQLLGTDPRIRRLLESQATQRLRELQGELGHSDEELARLRRAVADRLPHGRPSIEQVAPAVGLSVRQLQRLLKKNDTNYKSMVDELRCELAGRYVARPDLTLIDVALMLGFSEQASFGRAFRRWYGETPGKFRQGTPTGESRFD